MPTGLVRPIENYGAKELEMTIGDQESGQARCRMKWQVGDVEKNVLSAGKVTDTGLTESSWTARAASLSTSRAVTR